MNILAACAIALVASTARPTDPAGAFVVVPGVDEGRVRAAVETVAASLARNGAAVEVGGGRSFSVVRVDALPDVLSGVLTDLQGALASAGVEAMPVSRDVWTLANQELNERLWSAPEPRPGPPVTVAWTPRPDLLSCKSGAAAQPSPPRPSARIARVTSPATHCVASLDADPPLVVAGVPMHVADDESFFAAQLAAHILAGGYSSRLHRLLRVETRKVYTIESAAVPVAHDALTLRIGAQTSDPAAVRDAIAGALDALRARPVAQEELDAAMAVVRSRMAIDSDSPRAALYARALVLAGAGSEPRAGTSLPAITPRRLHQILQRTLDPSRLATVVLSAQANALCPPSLASGGGE